MAWNYIAVRLNGDGTSTVIDPELPLTDVSINLNLNSPTELTGSIAPHYAYMINDAGDPVLERWSTAVFAEQDGLIRGGGILVDDGFDGPYWNLVFSGYAGYPVEMAYTDSWFRTDIDPLDVFRHIWDHLQSKPRGNLGVTIDSTTSPIRIGRTIEQPEYDTGFDTDEGPLSLETGEVKLAWYTTPDLGDEISGLSEATPFDFTETHSWNSGHTDFTHHIRLGYPRLGSRRQDARFVIGENVLAPATNTSDEDYASEILALGAGEGAAMIHSIVPRAGETRIRRVGILDIKNARDTGTATIAARNELNARIGMYDVSSIVAFPIAIEELSSINLGDEVQLLGEGEWGEIDMWVRVVSIQITPDEEAALEFNVVRSGKIA